LCLGTWDDPASEHVLALSHGSDWAPQPVTLHRACPDGGYESVPFWFSRDYDYHMGLAVGDLTGNGHHDLVVAVFAGRDQQLRGGGVKVYHGSEQGLDPEPHWVARGFGATAVALGDLNGNGRLDMLVSCFAESGTAARPALGPAGFEGRARMCLNAGRNGARAEFEAFALDSRASRGAGDVKLADVDLTGELDALWAGPQTAVSFGRLAGDTAPRAPVAEWISRERHPLSACVDCLVHRALPTQQVLGTFDQARPELPSGFALGATSVSETPDLFAGFLDARGLDVRGAALRRYRAGSGLGGEFFRPQAEALPGDRLMAGRVMASPRVRRGPEGVHTVPLRVDGDAPWRVLTLPGLATSIVRSVEARLDGAWEPIAASHHGTRHGFTVVPGTNWLSVHPALPPGTSVVVSLTTAATFELTATSSAAWPPAGSSGVWEVRG
jgi:hypothetical protein